MRNNVQHEVLKRASLFLQKNNCEQQVAEILLRHHLNLSRTEFLLNMRETINEDIVTNFEADIEKHVKSRIPVQHLTGYEYFFGRKFTVNEHVLIPRPETEELVAKAIEQINKRKMSEPLTVVDVGTGSGVIAITLALEVPNLTVYATDISGSGLKVAKGNADILKAKVNFLHGDFLQPLIDSGEKADIVISNPPYIAFHEKESLSKTVKNFDPALALFADKDGLGAYEQIITQLPKVLKEHALVLFEIGHTQGEAVSTLLKHEFPEMKVRVIQDINNLDRIVLGKL